MSIQLREYQQQAVDKAVAFLTDSEIWKDITGYEGLYQVSNLGRVKSLPRVNRCVDKYYTRKGKVLTGHPDKDGYLVVHLSKNGIERRFRVHRIVAKSFIPNSNKLPQVNHINEIVNDNRVANLEWCDCKYNIQYGTGINRRAKSQMNRHGAKKVLQFTLDGKFVREFPSNMEVVRVYGFRQSHINECCLGKAKTAYGYKWKYAE